MPQNAKRAVEQDTMHDDDFAGLLEGMKSVAAYERGAREGFVTHAPESIDVRAIRAAREALAAWAQRLRPGGTLLISTPSGPDRMGAADEIAGALTA